MLAPVRILTWPNVCVLVHPDRVESCFSADGSVSRFHPPVGKPDFEEAARYAGYADSFRFGIEHDVLHSYVADRIGWQRSCVVWWDAHNQPDDGCQEWRDYEEHLVMRLQRHINTGERDADYGCLDGAFGASLPAVARNALLLVRPWLTNG
jgi:hypothetical protein